MTELISKDIVDLQDIEKVQFMQALQANPVAYQAYVAAKTGRILSETVDVKRAAFVKVSGDMARLMDMDHNSIAALDRTQDLSTTQHQILADQARYMGSKSSAIDQSRRQLEINNWYYENKRETLFILQFILLLMLSAVVVLSIETQGWITHTASNFLIGFIVIVGLLMAVVNWNYTDRVRDRRYWTQRTFQGDGTHAPPPPPSSTCIGPSPGSASGSGSIGGW